jgi:cyanophycin synthetase
MNFVEIGDFTVLMDFAHNPAGLIGLTNFIKKLPYTTRTAVLCGTGDRRDEDLREMGRLSAEAFDRIIIRRGEHLRGRGENEMYQLLQEGINEADTDVEVQIIGETPEAINYALSNAEKGELVVILADTVRKDVEYVKQFRDELFASENKL